MFFHSFRTRFFIIVGLVFSLMSDSLFHSCRTAFLIDAGLAFQFVINHFVRHCKPDLRMHGFRSRGCSNDRTSRTCRNHVPAAKLVVVIVAEVIAGAVFVIVIIVAVHPPSLPGAWACHVTRYHGLMLILMARLPF